MPMELHVSLASIATGVAALLMLIQMAFYYPRLPEKIAVHYDIDLEPGMYIHKALYYVLIIAIAALIVWSYSFVPMQLGVNGAVAIVFFVAVNQFIFMANAEAKRLSPVVFVFAALVIGYVIWVALHKHQH